MSQVSASLDREKCERKVRQVPAFSVATFGKSRVETGRPPSGTSMAPRAIPPTRFRQCYTRHDFPIQLEFIPSGQKLAWKVELERLDFQYYLPIFFGGLMETSFPYAFMARQAVHDMLTHGGAKIVPVIPQLIVPISVALNTRHPRIIALVIKAIQTMINAHPSVGPALLPYYRQILPIFSIFKHVNVNLGDGVEFSQRKRMNLGDLIQETLEMLEKSGGPHAFINIKYMIPTYESIMHN